MSISFLAVRTMAVAVRASVVSTPICPRTCRGWNAAPQAAILQPAPESASALAAMPITLFSLFSTRRR